MGRDGYDTLMPNQLQHRPALHSDGSDNSPATVAADRAVPAVVVELRRIKMFG